LIFNEKISKKRKNTMPKAKEIMTKEVVSVTKETPIYEAI